MKKIMFLLVIVIMATGCFTHKKNVVKKSSSNKKEIIKKEEYKDDNIMPISIYKDNGYKLTQLNDYQSSFNNSEDIGIFQLYPSKEKEITVSTSFPIDFYNTWNSIDKNNEYKIGFNLKYSLKDGRNISHNILIPSDTMHDDYLKYIIPYLYDDYVHINDSWYSHLEQKDYSDDTYYTSIKLYANGMANQIASKIKLTVFTYNGKDDFDSNNEYRGNSSYSISICNLGITC